MNTDLETPGAAHAHPAADTTPRTTDPDTTGAGDLAVLPAAMAHLRAASTRLAAHPVAAMAAALACMGGTCGAADLAGLPAWAVDAAGAPWLAALTVAAVIDRRTGIGR